MTMEREKAKYCLQCGSLLAVTERNCRERLECTACDYVFRNNPVPVVAAIVEREERILLARQKEWPPEMWALIAGFPEAGETMEAAILREVREETGLAGEVLGLVGVYSRPSGNQVFIVYRVRAMEGQVQVEEKELEAIREFTRYELPQVLANLPSQSGAARALRDWSHKESVKS